MAVDERVLQQEMAGLDALEQEQGGRARLANRVWSAAWPKLAAIAIALGLWQLVVALHLKPDYVLPGPGPVLRQLADTVRTAEFWHALATTMRRAVFGFSMAILVAAVVAPLVATIRPLRTAVGAMITGLQTMPSIAWFPLAILLFKLSEAAITFVVVLGAAPSIANGLVSGVDHVPPLLVRAGRMLGARGPRLFWHIVLPAALPSCLAGLKQGWAFAWRSLMAGELIVIVANRPSIGARLQFARELSDAPALLALMIVVLLVGIAVDAAFGTADRALRRRWGLVDTAT
ncbi:MAG: sulfonate transport system permease protein [Actinomycetota bacterium]|jgi:NitT/TauT family transport system permease protein|nr:sulfonate transport system permease protein [Actinomycetota bacterium]